MRTAIPDIAMAAGITQSVDRRPCSPSPRSRNRGRRAIVLTKINAAEIQKSSDWVLPWVQVVASISPQAANTSKMETHRANGFDCTCDGSGNIASDIGKPHWKLSRRQNQVI